MTNCIAELRAIYDAMNWQMGGEQWAARWGGTEVQWQQMILPRIGPYLSSAQCILELGGGMGRLSRYLEAHCDQLWITEISQRCYAQLEVTFGSSQKVQPMLTDGICLRQIPARSLDLVFSVFSLVHADLKTLEAALREIRPRLSADGIVFIHHSNAAALAGGDPEVDRKLARYRALSVSAGNFRSTALQAGFLCISQEVFGWDRDNLRSDCFSTLTLPGSKWAKPLDIRHNRYFCADAVAAACRKYPQPLY